MRDVLVDHILHRLTPDVGVLSKKFQESKEHVGVRYVEIDNFLPIEIAKEIYSMFPNRDQMRFISTIREQKHTSKKFNEFSPVMSDITFALQDTAVISLIEAITGIEKQEADPTLYAGGLSAMFGGDFLGPHIDNSHDGNRERYRVLNLLYYVTPNWEFENGGNLQLWDPKVEENVTIHSKFNRLVLMETTPTSWHSVSAVEVDRARLCVSNYYFSPNSPTGKDYFNVTSFTGLPSQRALRLWLKFDSFSRQIVRKIIFKGVGKKDVYEGPSK